MSVVHRTSVLTEQSDPFAALRHELFERKGAPGLFDGLVTSEMGSRLAYRAQLHPAVRPALVGSATGKTDLLTWYTRLEFAPALLLLSLVSSLSPYDSVARGEQIAFLRALCRQPIALHPERLLAFIGTSDYANNLVSMAFADALHSGGYAAAYSALRQRLATATTPTSIATLIDIAATHELDVLLPDDVLAMGERWAEERVILHALWRYCASQPLTSAIESWLLATLRHNAPLYDCLLILTVLRQHGVDDALLSQTIQAKAHPLLLTYLAPPALPTCRLTVAQTMFMGHWQEPGAGNSGGLSVFLGALGDALTQQPDLERMVTIVLADEPLLASLPNLTQEIAPNHWLLYLPLPHPREADQRTLLHHERALTWWATHLLPHFSLTPHLLHLRYADNGSLALARAGQTLGAKLLFTVTPDPHRTMSERYSQTALRDSDHHEALLFDLHKIFIADTLVKLSDGLVGIPGRSGSQHLQRFFPQLTRPNAKPLRLLAEGLLLWQDDPTHEHPGRDLIETLFTPHPTLPRLAEQWRTQPMMLNVGRFNPVKQQDLLVEAWLLSGAWRTHNLILIGGNLSAPTAFEQVILSRIETMMRTMPQAEGRLALLPALPNATVRLLERALVLYSPQTEPHLYLCSSVKEEFGIAILEAMDAGLLAIGPQRGGLSSYLTQGVNGFLVDTSTTATLARALQDHLTPPNPTRLQTIAAAGRATVRTRFDIHTVARNFFDYYQTFAPQLTSDR